MMRNSGGPNRKRGQALVEFSLVLPLVLLLVVGMLEFARAWNLHQVMTDAVREGARRAVLANDGPVAYNCPETSTAAMDSVKAPMWRYLAQFGYDPSYATMTVTPAGNFKCTGQNITVRLSLPYKLWVLGGLSSARFNMSSSLTARNE
jgi:Flp pilus assembly protein TadG